MPQRADSEWDAAIPIRAIGIEPVNKPALVRYSLISPSTYLRSIWWRSFLFSTVSKMMEKS